jgi:hypothetical protein
VAKASSMTRMQRKVARDLDRTLRAAGIDPTAVIQEIPAAMTEHDRFARERLFFREDQLVLVPID